MNTQRTMRKRGLQKARKGQAWSIDLVVGVLIFMLVIGIFYVLLGDKTKDDTTELKVSSEVIATKLVTGNNAIVEDDIVDRELLATAADKEYDTLKNELGIKNEFCIYFEDEKGNLVPIEDTSGNLRNGIGDAESGELNLTAGSPCGAIIG